MSDKCAVIVNPASANGATERRWSQIAHKLRRRLTDFSVFRTNAPGHASELVRDGLRQGFRHFISVGGDGTHNEVVNGCFDDGKRVADDIVLSVLPTGTGGDLRRTLGLPNSVTDAIEFIGQNRVRVDIGQVRSTGSHRDTLYSHFINISSFGVSGLVVSLVNESSKALGGKASFLMGVAKGTIKYKNQPMRIILDEGTQDEQRFEGRFYNGVVANAQYFGGGMHIAPNAVMTDGLFDVVLLADLSKWAVLRGTPSLFSGRHIMRKGVSVHRARTVSAYPINEQAVLIDLDGEQAGHLPAHYTILPGPIEICTGPDWQG